MNIKFSKTMTVVVIVYLVGVIFYFADSFSRSIVSDYKMECEQKARILASSVQNLFQLNQGQNDTNELFENLVMGIDNITEISLQDVNSDRVISQIKTRSQKPFSKGMILDFIESIYYKNSPEVVVSETYEITEGSQSQFISISSTSEGRVKAVFNTDNPVMKIVQIYLEVLYLFGVLFLYIVLSYLRKIIFCSKN